MVKVEQATQKKETVVYGLWACIYNPAQIRTPSESEPAM